MNRNTTSFDFLKANNKTQLLMLPLDKIPEQQKI